MKALITGASSGIGYDMAKYLSSLGYDIVAVARNRERLEKLKSEVNTNIKIISLDLSQIENCKKLYKHASKEDIDILINNAGFGLIGQFNKTSLKRELKMINTNIISVHILTKLFLKDMIKKNRGHILNVASIAGFMPGPMMATYYSSKAYVLKLSQAISKELKKQNSKVSISVLCPGPVATRFNQVANVKFDLKSLDSKYVAKYAIDKMLDRKLIILPGLKAKLAASLSQLAPDKLVAEVAYHIQHKKYTK